MPQVADMGVLDLSTAPCETTCQADDVMDVVSVACVHVAVHEFFHLRDSSSLSVVHPLDGVGFNVFPHFDDQSQCVFGWLAGNLHTDVGNHLEETFLGQFLECIPYRTPADAVAFWTALSPLTECLQSGLQG